MNLMSKPHWSAALSIAVSISVTPLHAQAPTGYEIEEFLGVTTYPEVAISPDGSRLAFISMTDDFEQDRVDAAVWVASLDESGRASEPRRFTFAPGSYSTLRWSPMAHFLLFLSSREGEPGPQLYLANMHGGEPRRLTSPEAFPEGVIDAEWMPDLNGILVGAPVPASTGLSRDDAQKEGEPEEPDDDVIRFPGPAPTTAFWHLARPGSEPPAWERLAIVELAVQELAVAPDGRSVAFVSGPPRKPEVFHDSFDQDEVYLLPLEEGAAPRRLTRNFVVEGNLRWSPDGATLYASGLGDPQADRSRWTQGRLFEIDRATGTVRNLAPDFSGELGFAFGSEPYVRLPDGSFLANGNVSTRTNLYRIPAGGGTPVALTDVRGTITRLSASTDGQRIAFVRSTADAYPEVYLAAGPAGVRRPQRVTGLNVDLGAATRPELETVSWSNGEGDTIEGVLYWPPGKRGAQDLPLVVDIHGGPWWARNEELTFNAPFTFAYYPALLASRGYLVLEPNYRGGTGRGDEFLRAIEGYSCSRPTTDILTGVDELVRRGWVDDERMGVMGYSYGGVLTNCVITRTDRFAAAASGAGIWNDISYFGTADNFAQNRIRNLGAPPWENLENYWQESAISRAGAIRTPTLITIGGADRRVPTSQAYELYRALVWLEVPARLLVFPGEPHGFRKPSHKRTKVRAEIAWLDHHLLGEPLATRE